MDANIHIDERDLFLAILEMLNGSTIEINLYDGNFGEI